MVAASIRALAGSTFQRASYTLPFEGAAMDVTGGEVTLKSALAYFALFSTPKPPRYYNR